MLFSGVTQLKRSTSLGYTALLTFSQISIINEMSLVFHNTTLASPRGFETAASTVKHVFAVWTIFSFRLTLGHKEHIPPQP